MINLHLLLDKLRDDYAKTINAFNSLNNKFEKEEEALNSFKQELFNPGLEPKNVNFMKTEELEVKSLFMEADKSVKALKENMTHLQKELENHATLTTVCIKFINAKPEEFSLETREQIKSLVKNYLESQK